MKRVVFINGEFKVYTNSVSLFHSKNALCFPESAKEESAVWELYDSMWQDADDRIQQIIKEKEALEKAWEKYAKEFKKETE